MFGTTNKRLGAEIADFVMTSVRFQRTAIDDRKLKHLAQYFKTESRKWYWIVDVILCDMWIRSQVASCGIQDDSGPAIDALIESISREPSMGIDTANVFIDLLNSSAKHMSEGKERDIAFFGWWAIRCLDKSEFPDQIAMAEAMAIQGIGEDILKLRKGEASRFQNPSL